MSRRVKDRTPFVVNRSGVIHKATCRWGEGGSALNVDALVHRLPGAGDNQALTALCCQARPRTWVERNHPSRLPSPPAAEDS